MDVIAFYDPEFDEVHTSYIPELRLSADECMNFIYFFATLEMAEIGNFGKELAERRHALGLTQHQLAHMVRISPGYIALIETMRRNPRPTIRTRIECVLADLEASIV